MLQPQEKPLYILPQLKKRAIIPKLFSLIILGTIFYLGVLLNLILLDLSEESIELVRLSSLISIFVLIVIGLLAAISRSRKKYYFYRDRITFNNNKIQYNLITNTNQKQNFLDKVFKTYSIQLNNKFSLKHIPKNLNMVEYVNSMVSYATQYNY
jgi:hypothetical protein